MKSKVYLYFSVLICFATLFMGVGYAALNSISLGISAAVTPDLQNGVFITEVKYNSSVNANLEESNIISAYQTNLNSHISLSKTDSNSSITYDITVYNSKDYDFRFDKVDFLIGEKTYSNENILFELNGLSEGDKLFSKSSITFSITFYYKDGILSDNNVLDSLLNFMFAPTELYELVAYYSKGDDSNIDFTVVPTADNSGIYTVNSTSEDSYPVHYYRGGNQNNNLIFGGFCWQIVRTTGTGGTKLLYYGEASENNQCLSGRAAHVGYTTRSVQPLSSQYYYGTNYIYDKSISAFKLDGELVQNTWSSATSSSLIGMFTCKNNTVDGTCTTLYQVVSYSSETQANVLPVVATAHFASVGRSMYNSNNGNKNNSLADSGYMYDVRYYHEVKSASSLANSGVGVVYSNNIEWNGTNYVLSDDRKVSENGWSTDRNELSTKYHYSCFSTGDTCSKVYYIYYFGDGSNLYYFTLENGKTMDSLMEEMLGNDENSTSSDMKLQVDNWYRLNMTQYTDRLVDELWCNERTFAIGALSGRNSNGLDENTYFSSYNSLVTSTPSVKCMNPARDGFTVSTESGGNGLLPYPVGMITSDELIFAGANPLTSSSSFALYSGDHFWTMSPGGYNVSLTNTASALVVLNTGQVGGAMIKSNVGIRPAIVLKPGSVIQNGIGSFEDPYIIE